MTDLPNRKSIRLQNYDYTQEGLYFVTICTQNRECIFGEIVNEKIKLNYVGKIIESVWQSLSNRFPVKLDTFQIMPNHIHMIIELTGGSMGGSRPAPTLGMIIGFLKSESSKRIGHPIWQRNYYEHIIRNETELNKIREYIQTNPQRWERDRNNID